MEGLNDGVWMGATVAEGAQRTHQPTGPQREVFGCSIMDAQPLIRALSVAVSKTDDRCLRLCMYICKLRANIGAGELVGWWTQLGVGGQGCTAFSET